MDRRKFIAMLGAAPVLTALGAKIAAEVTPSPFETLIWEKPLLSHGAWAAVEEQQRLTNLGWELNCPPGVTYLIDKQNFHIIGDDWPS